MGVDRELARAFGYFSGGVIALSAGAFALISFSTDNPDVIAIFLPLLVGYSVFVAILSMGLATYVLIRSRTSRRD